MPTTVDDVHYIDAGAYLERALNAYYRAGLKTGHPLPAPSRALSGAWQYREKEYVVLRNVNGLLAVYRVKPDGFLKGLRRWPKALDTL